MLLLPAVLPWELNQSIIGITEEEVRQEIIRLVRPYVLISDKELSQHIYSVDTGVFAYDNDYGDDLRAVCGYGLIIEPEDVEIFTSKDTKCDLDKLDEILEDFSCGSGLIEYEINYDESTRLLLFKARMPWEYDEHTKILTSSDIDNEILKAFSDYLDSEDILSELRFRMDDIGVCFYEGN